MSYCCELCQDCFDGTYISAAIMISIFDWLLLHQFCKTFRKHLLKIDDMYLHFFHIQHISMLCITKTRSIDVKSSIGYDGLQIWQCENQWPYHC